MKPIFTHTEEVITSDKASVLVIGELFDQPMFTHTAQELKSRVSFKNKDTGDVIGTGLIVLPIDNSIELMDAVKDFCRDIDEVLKEVK